MKPDYRFYLQINEGQRKAVRPNYPDDMSLDYEMGTGQRFFRAKLSSKLTFMREDYDLIMAAAFDSVYKVIIQKSNDMGLNWSDYYTGKFVMTDCTINTDDRLISVQPDTLDEYNDVLGGLDKEYNLVKLNPANQRIQYQRRPVLQIYALGDTILSSFLSGMTWEQDCEAQEPNDADYLINTCHFALNSILREIRIGGDLAEASGTYAGTINQGAEFYTGSLYPDTATGYRIDVVIQYTSEHKRADYTLTRIADNAALYTYSENATPLAVSGHFTMTPVSGSGMTGEMQADLTGYVMFARYILDVDEIMELPTFPILSDDMITDNKNYHYAIGYSIPVCEISQQLTWNVTEWGQNTLGQYYLPPNQSNYYMPLARSRWQRYSIWFKYYSMDEYLEQAGRADATIRDSYPIASVISCLLEQFSTVTFGETEAYSQFLYGSLNPISSQAFRLFMSQKSNITAGDYTIPAKKAPCTLGTVLNMLKNLYQCYWHIESGKLRIEHISWYKNGGSYSGSPTVGIDLTQMMNPRNGQPLSFAQNSYTFDKEQMPERYQFSWMDDCTDYFDGQPIQVLSKFVQEGKIEEVNISDFTADIDLMLLYPAGISTDGFALFAAVSDGFVGYELPYTTYTEKGSTFNVQNGLLALTNIIPMYWVYDLPSWNVKINNEDVTAIGIQRKRRQQVNFPTVTDPNLLNLIKTGLGNGEIKNLSINLGSRNAKTSLCFETTENIIPPPPPPPPPYDAEVEYLRSTSGGGQAIDTGIIYDSSVKIECRIQKSGSTSGYYFFGAMYVNSSNTAYRWALNSSSSNRVNPQFGTVTNKQYSFSYNVWHKFDADYRYIKIDNGSSQDTTASAFTPPLDIPVYLFGRRYINEYNSSNSFDTMPNCWFSYCKIWKSDVLVRDYIPVRVGTTGYMYDKVSGQLFGNVGTGDFILGNDVTE